MAARSEDMRADDLAAPSDRILKERNANVDWEAVDDVFFGCANQAGEDNRNVARMAALLAGIAVPRVPGHHHQPAVRLGPRRRGHGRARHSPPATPSCLIAGGVESMTRAPFVTGKADERFRARAEVSTPPSAGVSSIR